VIKVNGYHWTSSPFGCRLPLEPVAARPVAGKCDTPGLGHRSDDWGLRTSGRQRNRPEQPARMEKSGKTRVEEVGHRVTARLCVACARFAAARFTQQRVCWRLRSDYGRRAGGLIRPLAGSRSGPVKRFVPNRTTIAIPWCLPRERGVDITLETY